MTMRVLKITTHLRPQEAYTLIEHLDWLREALMDVYGDAITALLREPEQHEVDSCDDGMDADNWLE